MCIHTTISEYLFAVYMKLYWRYKKDGKWTWKPVKAGSPPEWLNAEMHEIKEELPNGK